MQNLYVPSGFLTRQTGDAHSEVECSILPPVNISSVISPSASPADSVGRRADCLIGELSPVSMSCCKTVQ